jgi:hypothetical protein
MGLVLFLVRLRRMYATVCESASSDAALHPAALLYSIAATVWYRWHSRPIRRKERRAEDDGSARPRRRGRPGDRRQRQRSGRGGRGAEKIGGTTPCSCICTWRRDATPNRSGAGYSAGRRRFGDARGRWRRSKGNRNAKHGDFTAEGLALKREIQALARMTRATNPPMTEPSGVLSSCEPNLARMAASVTTS